jgi:hypothetical protein
MEKAMESLAAEAEHINENDPRQAVDFMRKLTDMTGIRLGEKMEDALSRMEAGEDPEVIEQELGDIDESELFSMQQPSRRIAPNASASGGDVTFYEMYIGPGPGLLVFLPGLFFFS